MSNKNKLKNFPKICLYVQHFALFNNLKFSKEVIKLYFMEEKTGSRDSQLHYLEVIECILVFID